MAVLMSDSVPWIVSSVSFVPVPATKVRLLIVPPSVTVPLDGVIVSWTTLIQRSTPSELLGRAAAAGEALASIPYVGAIGFGSALVTMVDYRVLTIVAAAGLALAGIYLTRAPVLRDGRKDLLHQGGQVERPVLRRFAPPRDEQLHCGDRFDEVDGQIQMHRWRVYCARRGKARAASRPALRGGAVGSARLRAWPRPAIAPRRADRSSRRSRW